MKSLYRVLMMQPLQAAGFPALAAGRLWDVRAVHVAMLLSVVMVLNFVDLAYTLFAHRIGMLNEMNPVAEAYLSTGSAATLVCYKALMMLAGFTMIWKLRQHKWIVPGCWVLIVAYAGLGALWYDWSRNVIVICEVKIGVPWW